MTWNSETSTLSKTFSKPVKIGDYWASKVTEEPENFLTRLHNSLKNLRDRDEFGPIGNALMNMEDSPSNILKRTFTNAQGVDYPGGATRIVVHPKIDSSGLFAGDRQVIGSNYGSFRNLLKRLMDL
jgi:hypothetical protein